MYLPVQDADDQGGSPSNGNSPSNSNSGGSNSPCGSIPYPRGKLSKLASPECATPNMVKNWNTKCVRVCVCLRGAVKLCGAVYSVEVMWLLLLP